jgi:hypothetical protein
MCIKHTGGLSLRPELTVSARYVWLTRYEWFISGLICFRPRPWRLRSCGTAAPVLEIFPEDGGCRLTWNFGWLMVHCCVPNWWVSNHQTDPAVFSPVRKSFCFLCQKGRRHELRLGCPKPDPRAKCGPPEIVQQVFMTYVASRFWPFVWVSAESANWNKICIAAEGSVFFNNHDIIHLHSYK